MLTNTADIELFLDSHYEDIYWVSEKILAARDHNDRGGNMSPLNSFSWSQFEWFCAQLLRIQDWTLTDLDDNVSCGQPANNSKADIIATKGNQRIFVSCKHWANTVSLREVCEIYKTSQSNQHSLFDGLDNFAYLMTTNRFT